MSDFTVADLTADKDLPKIDSAKYALDMSLKTYRQWHIAWNIPLTVERLRLFSFLRDHGAFQTFTCPVGETFNAACVAWLANNGFEVHATQATSTAERLLILRRVAQRCPSLIVDTEGELLSYFAGIYEEGAEYLYASLETAAGEKMALQAEYSSVVQFRMEKPEPHLLFRAVDKIMSADYRKLGQLRQYYFDSECRRIV